MVVVDELGFHQATSVAELLADRGCQVEIVTNGMVVGQDLGITLDLETWNVRAHAKGIRQATDLVPLGASGQADGAGSVLAPAAPPDGRGPRPGVRLGGVLRCTSNPRTRCGTSCADAEFPVHRVGDCLAPRRAHAAVVEGHRVAVAL